MPIPSDLVLRPWPDTLDLPMSSIPAKIITLSVFFAYPRAILRAWNNF